MKQLKDISAEEAYGNEVFKELYAARPADREKESFADFCKRVGEQSVGNNGYELDKVFICTGKVFVKKPEEGDNYQAYVAVETDEANLSLKSLMGASTLAGYLTDNEATIINQFDMDGGQIASREVHPYVSEHLDISKLWNPNVRNFAKVVAQASEIFTAGTKITYRGTAVRQLTASKDGNAIGEKYRKGYKRAMSTRLWEVENPE